MNKYSKYIAEALNTKVPYTIKKAKDSSFAAVATIAGKTIEFGADAYGEDAWDVAFDARADGGNSTFGLTGDKAELQVFSFVKAAFEEFVSRYKPLNILFTADKDGGSDTRAKLYDRMLARFASSHGYTYETRNKGGGTVEFMMTRR